MSALNKKQTSIKKDTSNNTNKPAISTAANDLINESKKLASELYEESLNKLSEAELHLKNYSESFINKIKEKPFTSLLIAGGIGFLLSKLTKKQ